MMKKKDLSIEETFTLAIQNQQINDFIVAEKLYNEIIKRDPNYVNAHINLGILLIQNKKYHNARICFEEIL
jgi:tetratricopeptide (TPR) repeat protein